MMHRRALIAGALVVGCSRRSTAGRQRGMIFAPVICSCASTSEGTNLPP